MIASRKDRIDMTSGPFLGKIIAFIIPLCLTHILQNMYHAADLAVIGRFRGGAALAAIGSTGSLSAMVSSILIGLSTGAGVVAAQKRGAGDDEGVQNTIHSAIALALLMGCIGSIACFLLAPSLLRLIGVPDNVYSDALLYIRIIFCGLPVSLLYNYSAAIIRSMGDSRHPLIFLTISGFTNVILNLVMVLGFGLGVEGVAIATVTANALSALQMLVFMARRKGLLHFSPRKIRLHKGVVGSILYIGIPTSIQNTLFNFANTLVQSSVNAFGDVVIAGNTAAANLDNFPYVAITSVNQAAITFVGQNIGAKRYDNVRKITKICLAIALYIACFGAVLLLTFREFFVGLYVSDAATAAVAYKKLTFTMVLYPLVAFMEVMNSELRSMGKSITAMAMALFGACGVRLIWITLAKAFFPTMEAVFMAHPVSFIAGFVVTVPVFLHYYRRMMREARADKQSTPLPANTEEQYAN